MILTYLSEENINDLQIIAERTFRETFSEFNTENDLNQYCLEKLNSEALLEELANESSQFYGLYSNKEIKGYLKINLNDAQTEFRNKNSLEIERIYLLKELHGTLAGKLLLNKAIQLAKQSVVENIWLGVWEQNKRAISFYEKNGFKKIGEHSFTLGSDIQNDFIYSLLLNQVD